MTVCTGNICRSPMAEVVLRERLEAAGLAVPSRSTRPASATRSPATRSTRGPGDARRDGYPVPAHRARRVTTAELAERDLLLAMTAGHVRALRRIGGAGPDSGCSARSTRRRRRFADHLLDVDDPWHGPQEAFERTLAEIEPPPTVSWTTSAPSSRLIRPVAGAVPSTSKSRTPTYGGPGDGAAAGPVEDRRGGRHLPAQGRDFRFASWPRRRRSSRPAGLQRRGPQRFKAIEQIVRRHGRRLLDEVPDRGPVRG